MPSLFRSYSGLEHGNTELRAVKQGNFLPKQLFPGNRGCSSWLCCPPLPPFPEAKPVSSIPEPKGLLTPAAKIQAQDGEAAAARPDCLLPPSQHEWGSPFLFHPPVLEKTTGSSLPVILCFSFRSAVHIHFTEAAKQRLKNLQLSVIKNN